MKKIITLLITLSTVLIFGRMQIFAEAPKISLDNDYGEIQRQFNKWLDTADYMNEKGWKNYARYLYNNSF